MLANKKSIGNERSKPKNKPQAIAFVPNVGPLSPVHYIAGIVRKVVNKRQKGIGKKQSRNPHNPILSIVCPTLKKHHST
jgi:hypothetical protein